MENFRTNRTNMSNININKNTYKEIKALYNLAKEKGEKSFKYKDKEIIIPYAKYLLEFTEYKLNIVNKFEK